MILMAPALSSNSFSPSTPITHSKLRTPKPVTTTVFARTNLFGIGKPSSEGSESQDEESAGAKPNRFFSFDLSKLPDTKSLIPVVNTQSNSIFSRRKDPNTVFVAGATGQSGTRIHSVSLDLWRVEVEDEKRRNKEKMKVRREEEAM